MGDVENVTPAEKEQAEGMAKMATSLLKSLPDVIDGTTRIELGINLTKAE